MRLHLPYFIPTFAVPDDAEMKKIVDWFLFTSSLTAICAVGLCMATERLINETIPALFNPLHVFVFGCTLWVYNMHHAVKKLTAKKRNEITASRNWFRHTFSWIAGMLMAIASMYELPGSVLGVCGILGFISLAYSLPLLPFSSRKRIREMGWLKILALALVWTIVTSVLPILYWHKAVTMFPYEIVLRLAFIFALCVIFDIRDIKTDGANNIRTLPQIIGLGNSYRLITSSIILFVALSGLQYMRHPSLQRLCGAVITAGITLAVASHLRKHNSERAHLILGDGVMLLYSLLVLLWI